MSSSNNKFLILRCETAHYLVDAENFNKNRINQLRSTASAPVIVRGTCYKIITPTGRIRSEFSVEFFNSHERTCATRHDNFISCFGEKVCSRFEGRVSRTPPVNSCRVLVYFYVGVPRLRRGWLHNRVIKSGAPSGIKVICIICINPATC